MADRRTPVPDPLGDVVLDAVDFMQAFVETSLAVPGFIGGNTDGEVREESERESRAGDARAEARHAQERRVGQDGEEPQAGDRDRTFGGAQSRREGAKEKEGGCEEALSHLGGIMDEEAQ